MLEVKRLGKLIFFGMKISNVIGMQMEVIVATIFLMGEDYRDVVFN
ncbi:MAG: hypothetical protein KA270_11935 [Saprospiraceae bacterium]|nr:hypothetical protein [Saprospiraceae bacterium]